MFRDKHFVDARFSSSETLFHNEIETNQASDKGTTTLPERNPSSHKSDYPMMLKFIQDSIQGIDHWTLLFDDSVASDDDCSGHHSKLPTMASILKKAFRTHGTKLDPKQLITYETICATFLLQLINEGCDRTTNLGQYFSKAMETTTPDYSNAITNEDPPPPVDIVYASFTEENMEHDPDNVELDSQFFGNDDEIECSSQTSIHSQHSRSECSQDNMSQDTNESDPIDNYQDAFACDVRMNYTETVDIDCVVDQLRALGAKDQLIMFLTGKAGAGKTTASKLAQQFCFEFCQAIGVMWDDRSFLFTAWTGSAASAFGGVTIAGAAYLNNSNPLTEEHIDYWKNVRILIIDEISFMTDAMMVKLDHQLQICVGNRNKPYGGLSIIFAGDFRQLVPNVKEEQLLFNKNISHWENTLNVVIMLDSEHRFKGDEKYGKLLRRMWKGDLSTRDRNWLNTRVVGTETCKSIPQSFGDKHACYACGTNEHRNAINLGIFKRHVEATHPDYSNEGVDPPKHTIVIEANIQSCDKRLPYIGGAMRHRIINACGDANCVTPDHKHVDPALCLYVGAHVMYVISNKGLREKVPRGNGTLCRVVSVKLKDHPTSLVCKNYYGKKVWTVNALDVNWVELEHYPESEKIKALNEKVQTLERELIGSTHPPHIQQEKAVKLAELNEALRNERMNHRFQLKPEKIYCGVRCKVHPMAPKPKKEDGYGCHVTQIPINLNDATTGHKLQGMSKDIVIVPEWPSGGIYTNWEYVILSRVRTISGLFLLKPISMTKSFKPSEALTEFFKRAKRKQGVFLRERKKAKEYLMSKWGQPSQGPTHT